jgi:Mrp family chromosome partitioning ATPase/capsular polysaccharide biosynthesis protein
MEPQNRQPRIADYIRPLKARWWLIVVAVVVATGAVYAYFAHKPNVYSAGTLVYVTDPGDPVTGLPSPGQTDRNVADEATLIDSRSTAASIVPRIHYRGTADDLLRQVSITSKPGEDFVDVSANAGDPASAATIANAFAQALVRSLNGSEVVRIADALKLSQTELQGLPRGISAQGQRAVLADQINRLELALRVPNTIARQVNTAQPPTSPSSPKPLKDALFALILSLVAAVGVVYGLERFDRRLKNPDEMEAAYARPLLAVLPHSGAPTPSRQGHAALGSDFREPFRVLRTNIELASVDAPPRTIVVSSAMPGEGKSTVVRNLALAFREAGKRVAVVDLDLRHPALGPLFGIEPGPGVTDVMRREVELDDVVHRIGVGVPALDEMLRSGAAVPPASRPGEAARASAKAATASNGNGAGPHYPEISLLLSGARPANPPAVLASARLVEVLDMLLEDHDVVLIDSAPVLAVTDTVPLLRYADAALFVGRLDVATRDTARRLIEFLARVPDVTLLGIVANDLSPLEAGGYGYGYGYGVYADRSDGRRGRRKVGADQPMQPV